ncbi:MAG: hypothetical protein V3U28_05930 [Candidatus Acidoferrales bacterium]
MNPDNRRLLLDWLKAEKGEAGRLAALLAELGERHPDLAPLAHYLTIKEREERALQALQERERWYRSFSWRLVRVLFAFGAASLLLFVLWGGEPAFLASIFFLAGGAGFYLLVQAMATLGSHRDHKALAEIQERCRGELNALRKELRQ